MSRTIAALRKLEAVARLKADIELRRFSAFRTQVVAAETRIEASRRDLAAAASSDPGAALADWRVAHALVGYRAEALTRAQVDLDRMRPGFDAARQTAARAFGRAEALRELRATLGAQERRDAERRTW
ncbi:hypothetical protein [Paracoccus luteus]|uniref:hypothetical protein n=1 Tax=Paracoccus luteus TaxID=2508543 RepID=UPI00106F4927|nr:hypothetical protein [Paracoccus luteus]